MALFCFHASRFEARTDEEGNLILYKDQDTEKWDTQLIAKREDYLNQSAKGSFLSKYHLEGSIGYWHTKSGTEDNTSKWEDILQL
ncbi:MAG: putative RNA polymerase sigma factor [Saprospiraceae bacterium]|jgi:predicted RNA polymerase sigma factor